VIGSVTSLPIAQNDKDSLHDFLGMRRIAGLPQRGGINMRRETLKNILHHFTPQLT